MNLNITEIIARNFRSEKEQKAAEQILKLITDEKLSIAEIRGAAWEAMLLILKVPVVEFQRGACCCGPTPFSPASIEVGEHTLTSWGR